MKYALAAAFLGLASPVLAQPLSDAECLAAGACRTLEELVIEAPDGAQQRFAMGMVLPWITQGNVLLAPGEAMTIALHEEEGVLVPNLVATGDTARNTPLAEGQLHFDLGRIQRGQLILAVISRYSDPLDYGALKVSLGLGPERTSVCTLQPGVSVFETWQEPIYQLALFGFRKADAAACHIIEEGAELAPNGPPAAPTLR